MKKMTFVLSVLWLAGAHALTVSSGSITNKTNLVKAAVVTLKGHGETVVVDASNGLTLYTFDQDSANKSNCSGDCLGEWPPMHVPANAQVQSPFGTIKGNDGQTQLTLSGLPLYHYSDDDAPGDVGGNYPHWSVIQVSN